MTVRDNPTSRANVRDYIKAAFVVEDAELTVALDDDESVKLIERAALLGSFAYYPGDQIATIYGWPENPDYAEDDEEEEDNGA